jgi:PRTRC genetic system protein A
LVQALKGTGVDPQPNIQALDRDALLLSLAPLVAVPRFKALPADDREGGHRFLVARDGTYIEVTRPWLYAIGRIALGTHPAPFGDVQEKVELRCGAIPKRLLEDFLVLARKACPNETAAAFVWNYLYNEWRLVETALSANREHVTYSRSVRVSDDEVLVVDIHSHGAAPAFFSATDDRDDANGVKVAIVIGSLDGTDGFDIKARLCFFGVHVELNDLC